MTFLGFLWLGFYLFGCALTAAFIGMYIKTNNVIIDKSYLRLIVFSILISWLGLIYFDKKIR